MHFNVSTKCLASLCGEEMHEGWWNVVGILKRGTEPILPPHYKQGQKFKTCLTNSQGMDHNLNYQSCIKQLVEGSTCM